ncbi:MAG: hypothetical protein ACYCXB_09945 [Candidatus Humimicrobiaceae bacterium]
MFLLRLGSKRDIKYKLSTEDFLKNLCTITNIYDEKIAHHDTVEYFCQRLEPEQLYKVRHKMVGRLIRSKCLNRFRLLDSYFMIAIDGTGHLVYKERHCPHCLTKKKEGNSLLLS